MTPADITALRARACLTIAALGDVLDSLTVIEQTLQNPSDDLSDAALISQHLDEARTTSADLTEAAHTLAFGLDMARTLQIDRVRELAREAK